VRDVQTSSSNCRRHLEKKTQEITEKPKGVDQNVKNFLDERALLRIL